MMTFTAPQINISQRLLMRAQGYHTQQSHLKHYLADKCNALPTFHCQYPSKSSVV